MAVEGEKRQCGNLCRLWETELAIGIFLPFCLVTKKKKRVNLLKMAVNHVAYNKMEYCPNDFGYYHSATTCYSPSAVLDKV